MVLQSASSSDSIHFDVLLGKQICRYILIYLIFIYCTYVCCDMRFKLICVLFFNTEPLVTNRCNVRRKSVFVEPKDPEDIVDLTIVPKNDAQRAHLLEAIKNNLLFRNLESEQVRLMIT